jgi:CheY-like chemotaxis protein
MDFDSKAILLVEDNPDDVLLVTRAFTKAKLSSSIHIAENGDAAISYLSGLEPHANRSDYPFPALVLLDLKLPGKSGFEVLSWIRNDSECRLLPVVVFTSSREGPDLTRAYKLGANSYLTKPVRFEDLLDMIKTLNLYWLSFNESPALG